MHIMEMTLNSHSQQREWARERVCDGDMLWFTCR